MTSYKLLGLLNLQKNMLCCLVECESHDLLVFSNELIAVKKNIVELNSKGIFERRVSERRTKNVSNFVEKRSSDRRVSHSSFVW